MDDYTIERLTDSNISDLSILFANVYNRLLPPAFFSGKYNTKAFGPENLGYIAYSSNKTPVSFYGVIPCHLNIDGDKILAAQSADTMTHPKHRKKGLFLALARMTYHLAYNNGIEFIFGFPNQHSMPGFHKLNWIFTDKPMRLFVFPGSDIPFSRLLNRLRLLKAQSSPNSGQLTASALFVGEENAIIRNDDFLKYKSYSRKISLQFENSYVWAKNDGDLKIGYFRLQPDKNISWLIGNLTKTAKRLFCRKIIFMTGPNTESLESLRTVQQGKDAFPIGFYNLSERKFDFNKIRFEFCDIDIF